MRFAAICLFATICFADINKLIDIVSSTRDGASDAQIASCHNPFTYSTQENQSTAKSIEPVIKLQAILDGKALINDRWVQLGSDIYGYKVVTVSVNDVVLQKSKTKKTLSLKSRE